MAVAEAMRAGEDSELTTPESVRRHIARRYACLGPAACDLAKAASVICDDNAWADSRRFAGVQPHDGLVAAEELISGRVLAAAIDATTGGSEGNRAMIDTLTRSLDSNPGRARIKSYVRYSAPAQLLWRNANKAISNLHSSSPTCCRKAGL